jgi:hypothetical protein
MNARRVAVAAALLLAACIGSGRTAAGQPVDGAQGRQSAPARVPDISGGWLRVDSGSGSFDGTVAKQPPAALTDAGRALVVPGDGRNLIPQRAANAPANQAGEAYVVNSGACTPEGTGGSAINHNSTAMYLLQSKDEVLMVREGPGGRRFYMDGRGHPELARLTPSLYGHSTGRYEGTALVVETVGLSVGNVPGGGKRRPETRLTERMALSPDGKHLTITYTWDDPVLYVRPHTYEYVFERLPEDSYAFETWCDSSDPLQRQSIVPPK